LDATTVNDRQGKYKRTSIKLNCLDSHDSIKESRKPNWEAGLIEANYLEWMALKRIDLYIFS